MRRFDLITVGLVWFLTIAACPSRTQTYTAGQVINPSHVTENEDNIYNYLCTGVDTIKDGTVVSNDIVDGTITGTDISSSAAIAFSSLAALTAGNLVVGNSANVATSTALSGDATLSNAGVLTIADNSVDGTDIAVGSDAQGDLLYYNGTDWVRLGAGTSGQFLKTQGAAANPTWAAAGSHFVGSFTRNTSTASGTQAITGVGFQPSAVVFLAMVGSNDEASWGVDDGTNSGCVIDDNSTSADTLAVSTSYSIELRQTGTGTMSQAEVTTMGSDGFTVTWTKTGSPNETATIIYLAIR